MDSLADPRTGFADQGPRARERPAYPLQSPARRTQLGCPGAVSDTALTEVSSQKISNTLKQKQRKKRSGRKEEKRKKGREDRLRNGGVGSGLSP
ncbi:unnamed protein product [Arctogadus glacialis]